MSDRHVCPSPLTVQINDPTMDTVKVSIDREKNQISVYNNGKGIPVEMHKKEGIMIPELIFGNLSVCTRSLRSVVSRLNNQIDVEQL